MEQNGTTFGGLSQKQATALPHLLKPGSLADQARNAGIGRTTLHRWLRDDNFRRSLEQLREDALRLAESELQAMSYRGPPPSSAKPSTTRTRTSGSAPPRLPSGTPTRPSTASSSNAASSSSWTPST